MALDLYSASAVTAENLTWLLREQGVLREAKITRVTHSPIGHGLLADSVRFAIEYDRPVEAAPASLAGKFPSSDPSARANSGDLSIYATEVTFYREIAPFTAARVPLPYYAQINRATNEFGLLMEDLAPARQADQITGASKADAFSALEQAAALHGPYWNSDRVQASEWLDGTADRLSVIGKLPAIMALFHERYDEILEPEYMRICDQYIAKADKFLLRKPESVTVAHTDYRLDNMMFNVRGGASKLAVLDWQTVSRDHGALDVAYFLGFNIPVGLRRQSEKEFLAFYLEELRKYGVVDCTADELWREYRIGAHFGVFCAIAASIIAKRTERSDQLFMAIARRSCTQMMDLETLSAVA